MKDITNFLQVKKHEQESSFTEDLIHAFIFATVVAIPLIIYFLEM